MTALKCCGFCLLLLTLHAHSSGVIKPVGQPEMSSKRLWTALLMYAEVLRKDPLLREGTTDPPGQGYTFVITPKQSTVSTSSFAPVPLRLLNLTVVEEHAATFALKCGALCHRREWCFGFTWTQPDFCVLRTWQPPFHLPPILDGIWSDVDYSRDLI